MRQYVSIAFALLSTLSFGFTAYRVMASKYKGGLYIWRVRKPHALIGLPFIGRHIGYAGMTNSYRRREREHLEGSITYGTLPAAWSDLNPKCYRVLPLPPCLLRARNTIRREWIVKRLETALIWLTIPVYNETQQAPYNMRRIRPRQARAERKRRDEYGRLYRVARWGLAIFVRVAILALGIYAYWQVRY